MNATGNFDKLSKQEKKKLVEDILDKKNGRLDTDWAELCEKYHLDISPDTLRKAGVGIKLAEEAESFKANKVLTDGYTERQKLRDLQREINNTKREMSRTELLMETIRESVKTLPEVKYVPYSLPYSEKSKHNRELIIALGDIHYGAEFTVHDPYGKVYNEYNPEVFDRRMKNLLNRYIEIQSREHCPTVHIFLVGDLMDGMLRQSQLMRLRYGVIESTIKLSEYIAQWIMNIASYASTCYVHSVMGNHSEIRPLGSKKGDFEDENMEKIIYWYLKERLSEVDCIVCEGDCRRYHVADVCGYKFLLLHGDESKNITEVASDLINIYGMRIDYFVCGHKHRESEYPTGATSDGSSVVIRVPSICGTDRFAQTKLFGGKAGATIIIMEDGRGRYCTYPIELI